MVFRPLTVPVIIASTIAAVPSASAGPLEACAAVAATESDLGACLEAKVDASYATMNEALATVRAAAQARDRASESDAAVFALESSQHAWEAFRDTNCELRDVIAGASADPGNPQLACEIEMTRERAAELLALADAMSQ